MVNRPAQVSQIEVKRSVSGALAAGLRIGRVEIDHKAGKVTIIAEGSGNRFSFPDPDELLR